MKKILLGLMIGTISTSGWSVCNYSLNATQQDLQAGGANRFQSVLGSKVSYRTQLGDKVYAAMSKTISDRILNAPPNTQIVNGDRNLTTNGIKVFEYKIKLPQVLGNGMMLNMFPAGAMGKMENGDGLAIMIMYQKLGATNSFYISTMESGTNNSVGTPIVLQPQNTVDGYQHFGIYFNQNSQQVGVIFNGVNQGYTHSYSSKLKNIYFMIGSNYTGVTAQDADKELSVELITDKALLKKNYLTGATDICNVPIR